MESIRPYTCESVATAWNNDGLNVRLVLDTKVSEMEKKKNEYSAWELLTPFRLFETGLDKMFPLGSFCCRYQSRFVDPLFTLIACECRKTKYTYRILL